MFDIRFIIIWIDDVFFDESVAIGIPQMLAVRLLGCRRTLRAVVIFVVVICVSQISIS